MADLASIPERDLSLIIYETLVTYRGEVHFVVGIENKKVFLRSIENEEEEMVQVPFEEISGIQPYYGPLGYVNTVDGAGLLSRYPRRQYRAGLHRHNIVCHLIEGLHPDRAYAINRSVVRTTNKNILQPRDGNYPILAEALDRAVEYETAYAYNKSFAVDFRKRVYYLNNLVGRVEEGAVKFLDKFSILRNVRV